MRLQKKLAFLLVMLIAVACTDAQLTKLSKALDDTAIAMGQLQTMVIAANKQNLIPDSDTESIIRLCYKINDASQRASTVTRNLTKLTAPASSSVLAILQPVIQGVQDALSTGTLGIKDGPTKSAVTAALVAIQTGLNTAQVVLAATGGK